MKQRFRARELWLFAPFLLIGAAALFYWRWERVNPPGKRGMYVAKIARAPATAKEESRGVSHHVTVTLAHSWPRPRWWGELKPLDALLDPLHPEKPTQAAFGAAAASDYASGSALTGVREGREIRLPAPYSKHPGSLTFERQNYVIDHPVKLRDTNLVAGEITFRGLYRLHDQTEVAARRVVRARGETFPPINKDPGAEIVYVRATKWEKTEVVEMNNVLHTYDSIGIEIKVRPTKPLAPGADKHVTKAVMERFEDAAQSNFGHTQGMLGMYDDARKTDEAYIDVSVDEAEPTIGPLTVSGEITVDDRWPMPFKLQLPPRPPRKAAAKPVKK